MIINFKSKNAFLLILNCSIPNTPNQIKIVYCYYFISCYRINYLISNHNFYSKPNNGTIKIFGSNTYALFSPTLYQKKMR